MKVVVEIGQDEVMELVRQHLSDRGVSLSGPLQVVFLDEGQYDDRETVGFKMVADVELNLKRKDGQ